MTRVLTLRRAAAVGLVAGLALLLSACFVLPGKFAANLDIRKDGHFTFGYKGQVFVLGLSKLAEMAMAPKDPAKFEPSPCFADDAETERPCTKPELATQKSDWETAQQAAADKARQEAEMLKKVFGGIDPNDPKSAEELASRLRGQAGFNSVIYQGNGLYAVDYSIAGTLDHDYAFPTIERMNGIVPFLVINRRANGELRIDSPLMQQAALSMPGGNAFQMLAQMQAARTGKKPGELPDFPVVDGHFTLTTDAAILSNNTEHGPKTVAGGKQLDWDINFHTPIAPMALVALAK